MDFDFTTETITPDSTTILTIGSTGALELPSGTTAQEPVGAIAGALRWNTTLPQLEYYNGTVWLPFGGSVTSVAVSGANGIGVSGSPITSSGTIALSLGAITPTSVASSGAVSGTTLTASGLTANSFLYSGTGGLLTTTSTPTNGQLLIGSTGAAPVLGSLTAGTAISVTNGAGTITINNTGVTSAIGTANQVNVSAATGAVTFSLPQSINTTATPTFNQVTITNSPVNGTDAANKNYVDAAVTGLSWKQVVRAATTVNGTLATAYANGQTIDGITLATGDRILIKNQTTQTENGLYTVNAAGAPTRSTDADTGAELVGAAVFVDSGTANADTGWVQTTIAPITIGSSNIVWQQFTGSGTYSAGTGLTLTGNTFSLTSPVTVALGGTGLTTTPTNGQIDIGNGTNFTRTTITAGTAISVTNGAGSITIANTGVTSITGTANQITASAATGAVTLSLPAAVTIGTSLTVSGLTANSFLYSGTAGLLTTTTAPTNGQLLIGSTGAAPVAATLTAGTGVSVTNGAGSITIANTGVTSVSLNDASTTAIYTTAPTGATTGAVAETITLKTQTANLVFAGPTTGGATQPTFRALVKADVINGTTGALVLYNENPSSPTQPTVAGTNAVAIGTGAAASGTNAFAVGNGSSASQFGVRAYANGDFATAGDSQAMHVLYRVSTANNTATEMFLDGAAATQRLVLPNNSTWTYTIQVAMRRTDATGTYGSWIFRGTINRDATAATTTIPSGGISKTTIARVGFSGTTNDPVVSADTTNGSLKIAVTGITGNTIRWVADAELVQVTN